MKNINYSCFICLWHIWVTLSTPISNQIPLINVQHKYRNSTTIKSLSGQSIFKRGYNSEYVSFYINKMQNLKSMQHNCKNETPTNTHFNQFSQIDSGTIFCLFYIKKTFISQIETFTFKIEKNNFQITILFSSKFVILITHSSFIQANTLVPAK